MSPFRRPFLKFGGKFQSEPLLIFLTMLPVTGVVPILKVFVMDGFHVSELAAHLFLAFNMISAFIFAPLAGALADRWGSPRTFMTLAAILDALLFFLMPHAPNYATLMALRFLEGMAHISVLSLLLAVAAGRTEHGRKAMGIVGAALTIGVAIGSPLGGWLGELSTTLALSVGGCIMLLVALVGATTLDLSSGTAARQSLSQTLSTLFRFPGLRLPYLFAFLDRFTVGFFVASFPIFATTKFGFTPSRIGLTIAAFMLTMGLLCYPTVKLSRHFSLRTLILWGSGIYGILFACIGWIPENIMPVWMIALGAASAVMFIPTLQLTAASAPDYARATAMGGFTSAGALGFLLGPIVSGVIFASLSPTLGAESSYTSVFLCGGLVEVMAVGAVALYMKSALSANPASSLRE